MGLRVQTVILGARKCTRGGTTCLKRVTKSCNRVISMLWDSKIFTLFGYMAQIEAYRCNHLTFPNINYLCRIYFSREKINWYYSCFCEQHFKKMIHYYIKRLCQCPFISTLFSRRKKFLLFSCNYFFLDW